MRAAFLCLSALLLGSACTKEEPTLQATLHASCRDCIVSHAIGPEQSRRDTLTGALDAGTGEHALVTMSWPVEVHDGDQVFLRGCQRDSTFEGEIQLWVDGAVAPINLTVTSDSCGEINQALHAR